MHLIEHFQMTQQFMMIRNLEEMKI